MGDTDIGRELKEKIKDLENFWKHIIQVQSQKNLLFSKQKYGQNKLIFPGGISPENELFFSFEGTEEEQNVVSVKKILHLLQN